MNKAPFHSLVHDMASSREDERIAVSNVIDADGIREM
jgi:hypothetical protein